MAEHNKQEVVFITGTSSGFGLLTTIALAKQGYVVIATMRDLERKQELASKAEQEGCADNIRIMALDVTQEQQIEEVVAAVMQQYGSIDILINNAGFAQGGFVEEIPLSKWREQFETNFFGLIKLTQAVLPVMRARRKGRILNISSISGLISSPSLGPYASSKFAVEGFSEALRLEMLPYGIYVSLIEPGSFQTSIWQKGLNSAGSLELKESAYQQELESVTRMIQKTGRTAPQPEPVIRTILQVIHSKKPKLRYPVGEGVRTTIWLKKLLPWSWLEKAVISKIHRKKR